MTALCFKKKNQWVKMTNQQIFPFVFQVTVLIYNDLMLLTREDEVERCNVLQSPLYLNTLQLREGISVCQCSRVVENLEKNNDFQSLKNQMYLK